MEFPSLKGTGFGFRAVSWEDVSRFSFGDGSVSCYGPNITDVRLTTKFGKPLHALRSDNWDEKLGVVSTDDVRIVTGNYSPTGDLELKTLTEFLKEPHKYAAVTGVPEGTNLLKSELDKQISVRFQSVFIPVTEDGKMEFCADHYNYQTRSTEDPKNFLLLSTGQGIAFQTDKSGNQKLMHHAVSEDGKTVHDMWLSASSTSFAVGKDQSAETESEAESARSENKAAAVAFGLACMGKRTNAVITVQIPRKQVSESSRFASFTTTSSAPMFLSASAPVYRSLEPAGERKFLSASASAARVSIGERHGKADTLKTKTWERHPTEHITVTVTLYHALVGGEIPKEEDVLSAYHELLRMYGSCDKTGRIAELEFMKIPTVDTVKLAPLNRKVLVRDDSGEPAAKRAATQVV